MKRYEKIREHYIELWRDATAHSVAAFVKYDCPPGSNKNKCGRYRFSDHTSVCNQCWIDYLNQDADETDIDYSNAKHSVRMNLDQRVETQVTRCPKCDSSRIFSLRIDSDWGGLIGNYCPANDKDKCSEYTEEDLKLDGYDRPDIDLYHCLNCDHMWEVAE